MFRRSLFFVALVVVVASCSGELRLPGCRNNCDDTIPELTILNISPSSGNLLGGDPVVITGTGFTSGVSVLLGGAPCTNVQLVSSTSLSCISGAYGPGLFSVSVTRSGSVAEKKSAFAYGGNNVWYATSTTGAPAVTFNDNWHDGGAAIWTGTRVVVWGGITANSLGATTDTGGVYDPISDSWSPTGLLNAPTARVYATKIWTGNKMIVWGGVAANGSNFNTGGLYDPTTDSWTAVSTVGAPSARDSHTAIWTGTRMLVWGGEIYGGAALPDGAEYNPQSDTWNPISSVGAASTRLDHTAVWTGTEMIVWGGANSSGTALSTGGIYNPQSNTWRAMSNVGAPAPRYWMQGVWTGKYLLVWGGYDGSGGLSDGGLYDLATDLWVALPSLNAPSARYSAASVWTGKKYVVWGGATALNSGFLADGASFDPSTNTWTTLPTIAAPSSRHEFSFVWTGSQLVLWGGIGTGAGGRFTP